MTSAHDDEDRTRILSPTSAPAVPTQRAASPMPSSPTPGATPAASSAGDSGNALPLGTYLSEFEITRVIGEGGFGIVYDAWDHSLERRVALKEYMPASLASRESTQVQVRSMRHKETFDAGLKSFVNEAKLLAQFDHPSLVKVYRFWEANGTAYMVMPLYQGITLKDKLKQFAQEGKKPDEAWLMSMLAPLTEALAVIHAENCFHRDIAPDNIILLTGSERPLLLDFGAARRVIGDMTQALTVILKPGYAPVEQYAETPNLKQGAWTDVYALAASMHYAMLGKTPPPSVSRLMSDAFTPMAQSAEGRYSQTFLRGLDKALSVRPEERTQSIAELRSDLGLDAWAASQPTTRIRTVQPTHVAPRNPIASGPPTAAPAPRAHGAGSDAPTEISPRTEAGASSAATAGWEPAPKRSRTGLFASMGVGALGALGIAIYFAMSGGKAPTPAPAVVAAPAPAPAPAPVVATPAPAPAPAAARPFDVREEFEKVVSAQTAGFDVSARPLKPTLRIGRDQLSFEITSSRDGFVRVLLLGPDQSLLQLYPNDTAKEARIKAGQRLLLPQSNWPLLASEPAGPEHFLVVVSAAPRHYGELIQGSDYIFKKFVPTARAQEIAARRAADAPPLLLGLTKDCSPSATDPCETYGAALFSIDVQR